MEILNELGPTGENSGTELLAAKGADVLFLTAYFNAARRLLRRDL